MLQQKIALATEKLFFNHLFQLAADKKGSQEVLTSNNMNNNYLSTQWAQFLQNPNDFKAPTPPIVPRPLLPNFLNPI